MLIVRRALLLRILRLSMLDVRVLSADRFLFGGVRMCILGGVRVEGGCHGEMMSDEQQAEADVSFLAAEEFACTVAACGSGGTRRAVRSSNSNLQVDYASDHAYGNVHVTEPNISKYSYRSHPN
jgi:hypothetical protein